MTTAEFGSFTLVLLLILAAAHLCGYIFQRLRQPRVVGEICAGILIGPSVLGHFASHFSTSLFGAAGSGFHAILFFLYNLGLLLLMFHSGAETRNLFGRGDRKETSWLAGVGTGLPFLIGLLAAPWLPVDWLMGPARQRSSLVLVTGIAIAVTSIPVISRIFYDLRILHTRFARLVLGVAVLEDIVLWAVLGIATALAKSGAIPRREIANHVAATIVFFVAGLVLMPRLLRRINTARWNVLSTASPAGYLVLVLFLYSAVASASDVSLVFAAFLAGFAIGADQLLPADALASLGRVSFAVFIPIYFAIVGYRLDLGKDFSLSMLALFVVGGCVVKLISAGMGARLARFRGLDAINLAVALNARGGPGIVLASVAYDAGIINGAFFTTLVLMAIITSQAAGVWLEYVLRKGWPLLSGHPEEAALAAEPIAPRELAA
jgi:Kef-type K+ transport system membrane component KefB